MTDPIPPSDASSTPPPIIIPPPVVEPIRFDIACDDEGNIAEPVACRQCGYNLQGLQPGANCPECATPVFQSIRGDELHFCDPNWVTSLAKGTLFILIGILTTFGGGILFGVGIGVYTAMSNGVINPNVIVSFSLVFALPSLLIIFGSWRLTAPDPGQTDSEPTLSARRLTRWCMMASVVAIPMKMMGNDNAAMMGNPAAAISTQAMALQFLTLFAQGVTVVGYVAALLYLTRLARRIPHPALATQSRIVMWGYGIVSFLGLVFGLVVLMMLPSIMGGITGTGGTNIPFGIVIFFSVGSMVTVCGSLIFNIWAIVLLFRFRSEFTRQAEFAKANWTG
ncbi:MAG: hypothetical protein O7G85_15785 [Planctomycetota bacterium]|nr:hypothetical protein [Planctomycetota bacterium]